MSDCWIPDPPGYVPTTARERRRELVDRLLVKAADPDAWLGWCADVEAGRVEPPEADVLADALAVLRVEHYCASSIEPGAPEVML